MYISLSAHCHRRINIGTIAAVVCLNADGGFSGCCTPMEKNNIRNFCSTTSLLRFRTLAHQHQLRINWKIQRGENDTNRQIPTTAMTSIAILKWNKINNRDKYMCVRSCLFICIDIYPYAGDRDKSRGCNMHKTTLQSNYIPSVADTHRRIVQTKSIWAYEEWIFLKFVRCIHKTIFLHCGSSVGESRFHTIYQNRHIWIIIFKQFVLKYILSVSPYLLIHHSAFRWWPHWTVQTERDSIRSEWHTKSI